MSLTDTLPRSTEPRSRVPPAEPSAVPGTTRAVRRGTRPGFLVGAAIVLLAVVKGLLWSQLVPPWYGPDELAHFTYVQDLAMTGHVQQAANGRPDGLDIPPEAICSTQALGFRSNGPFFAEPPFVPGVDPCPRPPLDTGRLPRYLSGPAGNYSPVYYGMAVPFWMAAQAGDVVTRLEAVRMLSVLLGALAALCCYLAAWWAVGR